MHFTQETDMMIGAKDYPAISIILPTHPQYPGFKADKEHMIELVRRAEDQLAARFSKHKTGLLMDRLHEAIAGIDYTSLSESLAIYVSEGTSKVIHLPFEVSEKVIVDDSFEVRDLIYSAKLNRQYLLVSVTKNGVRTAIGFGNALLPVKYKDMPRNIHDVKNSHSLPGWDYLDTEAYDENNLRNYLHFIDETVRKAVGNEDLPIIFAGDVKLLGYLRTGATVAPKVIGYIEGNLDHATVPEIRQKVQPILDGLNKKQEEEAMLLLQHFVSKNQFSAGIAEVWRSVSEGKARLLLVERDYREAGMLGDDEYTFIPGEPVSAPHRLVADAVDDLIEHVIRHKGDVQFVPDGTLAQFQRIASVNRY
ncbi:MAG: hypothetical protein RL213_1792 [Bacteroidota bacterium]|jgi:hypothetical protein